MPRQRITITMVTEQAASLVDHEGIDRGDTGRGQSGAERRPVHAVPLRDGTPVDRVLKRFPLN